MKLWSIQSEEAFDLLQKEGVFHCAPEFIEDWLFPSYDWMVKEMVTWIGPPPVGARYPIWAWHTTDWRRKRPDQRRIEFRPPEGSAVCLELDIAPSRVLLSDEELWHWVLNDFFVSDARNQEDSDKAEAWFDSLPHEQQKSAKECSWRKVFDVTPFKNDWTWRGKFVQATFWELRREDVVGVRRIKIHGR